VHDATEYPRYRRRMDPAVPSIDAGARRRLTARFGAASGARIEALVRLASRASRRLQP